MKPFPARLKKVPIWNFHGDQDETVSVQGSRDMVEALEKARAPIKYTEMKGEGHGIPGKVYQQEEVHVWLFSQKREQPHHRFGRLAEFDEVIRDH